MTVTDIRTARPIEPRPTEALSKRRRGGRVAPQCDDTQWCGLTLYEHQAPHRESLIVEITEIETLRTHGKTTTVCIKRRIELCSWPCVENLAAARMHERANDEQQRRRRDAKFRASGVGA